MRIFITILFLFLALPYYTNKNIADSDKWKTLLISVSLYFFTGIFLHWGLTTDTNNRLTKNVSSQDIEQEIDKEIERLKELKKKIKKNEKENE